MIAPPRDPHAEGASFTLRARSGYVAAVEPSKLPHEREPNAGPFEASSLCAVDAMKSLEDVWKLVGWYPDAGIPNGKLDLPLRRAKADLDLTFEGELERIRDQVENDLFPRYSVYEGWLRKRRPRSEERRVGK